MLQRLTTSQKDDRAANVCKYYGGGVLNMLILSSKTKNVILIAKMYLFQSAYSFLNTSNVL